MTHMSVWRWCRTVTVLTEGGNEFCFQDLLLVICERSVCIRCSSNYLLNAFVHTRSPVYSISSQLSSIFCKSQPNVDSSSLFLVYVIPS